ncbi:hypothetical protein HDV04_005622, partial [Boothiomyces sp. JEL0838]
ISRLTCVSNLLLLVLYKKLLKLTWLDCLKIPTWQLSTQRELLSNQKIYNSLFVYVENVL